MNLPQISNLNTNLCTLHPWGNGHDGSASHKDGEGESRDCPTRRAPLARVKGHWTVDNLTCSALKTHSEGQF